MTDIATAAADRVLTGKAWDDFCENLRRAGHMVDKFGDEAGPLDKAEWYRFMTRLARNAFERYMENAEPDRPRLRDAPWRQGINFQSPDQDHLLSEFIDACPQSASKWHFKRQNHAFICRAATAGNARPARTSGGSKSPFGACNWEEGGLHLLRISPPYKVRNEQLTREYVTGAI